MIPSVKRMKIVKSLDISVRLDNAYLVVHFHPRKIISFLKSVGCTDDEDCQNGFSCVSRKCRAAAGKVLLGSINIKTLSCTNCSPEDEGVLLTLRGERLTEYTDGFPCQTSVQFPLNKKDSQDFQTGEIAKFDGSTRDQQQMMGDCFKVGLQ